MPDLQRWCVAGGGMLGLTLAHRLRQQGHAVTLYESAGKLGGLATSWRIGDVEWDRYYHVLLYSDLSLRKLLGELGIDGETVWKTTKTGFFVDEVLHPFTSPSDLLRFPALNLIDKARLVSTILFGSQIADGKRFEAVTVEAWLRRWSGARTFEKFWKPLLRAKLGENYQYASASFIWATIRRLFAARRAGLEERFGYVPGGYDRILKRFEEVLRAEGVELRFNAQLTGVKAAEAGVDVTFADGTGARYERVVMTLPGPVAAKSCADFSPAERTSLLGIRYQGIVCPSLLLSRPLGPYYVTNIADASIPFTGVIEMSTLVSPSEFGGSSLVYLPKYVDPADPLFERSDDEIQDQFLAALAKMYPDFQRQTVRAFQVSRARHVFAIPTLNYSSSIPPVKTSVPGVYVLNSSHIVNGTLNVNETVQLVETHLPLLLS